VPAAQAYKDGMTVDLRPITKENFRAVIKLEVRPEQADFVAPNLYGLAETHIYPDAEPRAVYAGDDLVGFVLFHPIDKDRPAEGYTIVRLMIDHRFQGRGLGRQALEAAVDWIAREREADRARLSVVASNAAARGLYRSAGFVETGELDDGELVMVRTLR
jgi:diamine N-acetyltransferase